MMVALLFISKGGFLSFTLLVTFVCSSNGNSLASKVNRVGLWFTCGGDLQYWVALVVIAVLVWCFLLRVSA